jgi:hypothetical protein
MLGYLSTIRLAQRGTSCGVRELAPAVCRPGVPGRPPRINLGTLGFSPFALHLLLSGGSPGIYAGSNASN